MKNEELGMRNEPGNTDNIQSSFSIPEYPGVRPEDFGTLVHAVLEARLKEQTCIVPQKIRSRIVNEKTLQALLGSAQVMADGFLTSGLGKRLTAAIRRESEFPIITSITIEGKPIAVTGQIDLLFEEENEVVVVDFKTDKTENPEDYYGQLAVYNQAAADIFGKPVSVWLYYLRSGRAVNVSGELNSVLP